MMDLKKAGRRAPNYIRQFGWWAGLRLALTIEKDLPVSARSTKAFHLPGWQNPVHLRDSLGDHATFWQCLVQDQYDFDQFPQAARLQAAYARQLASGRRPLIIDGGANIGLASMWLARRFPEALIVAVEPDRDNFALLQQNLAPFGDQVQALKGGIWNEDCHVRIENPDAGSAAFRVVVCSSTDPDALRTYTIGGICGQFGELEPLIVKLDIEGAQGAVFSGAIDWVGRSHMIVLELDDWQLPWVGTSRSFFSAVSQWPFDYLLGGESIFCFRDFEADASGANR